MTDKTPPSADTAAETGTEAPAKAKIVLPKLGARNAGPIRNKGQAASFNKLNGGHSQTLNNKPPRLPGRNG